MADKNLKNLLALDDRNPKNYFVYCKFLLRIKNYEKAEEMIQKALGFESTNTEY